MEAPDSKDAVLARYMAGPALLEEALTGIQDSDLDAPPSQGGWTIRQIVHHVVDGDDIWKSCIKMALGNEQGEFSLAWYWTQPQEAWAKHWAYADRSPEVSLALLKANRSHIQQILKKLPDGWHRSVGWLKFSGETERMAVGAIIEMQAGHLEHHVRQIAAICAELRGE